MTGCVADIAPLGVEAGVVAMTGCFGSLSRHNRPTNMFSSSSLTINAAATGTHTIGTTYDLTQVSTPGIVAFRVDLMWRNSSGAQTGIESFNVGVAVGSGPTNVISALSTTPSFDLTNAALATNGEGVLEFSVDATNNNAFNCQTGMSITYLGTGRGVI